MLQQHGDVVLEIVTERPGRIVWRRHTWKSRVVNALSITCFGGLAWALASERPWLEQSAFLAGALLPSFLEDRWSTKESSPGPVLGRHKNALRRLKAAAMLAVVGIVGGAYWIAFLGLTDLLWPSAIALLLGGFILPHLFERRYERLIAQIAEARTAE